MSSEATPLTAAATSPSISFAFTRAESILGFSCSGFGSEATGITVEVDKHVHTWAVGLFKYEFNELLSLEENDLPSLELWGKPMPITAKWRSLIQSDDEVELTALSITS